MTKGRGESGDTLHSAEVTSQGGPEVGVDERGPTVRHDCVICLEAVTDKAIAQPCSHDNFDFICLVSWLQLRQQCPLCKAQVQTVEYRSVGDHFKSYQVPSPATNAARTSRTDSASSQHRSHRNRSRRNSRAGHSNGHSAALGRRRQVYRDQTYSMHVGSNKYSRYREVTPGNFATDAELVARARRWIRRELQVFDFLNNTPPGSAHGLPTEAADRRANNAEFLLEYIVAILKSIDLQGSTGQAEELLHGFLGRENTRLFIHELRAWLRSPYMDLADWDRNVQYRPVKLLAPELPS